MSTAGHRSFVGSSTIHGTGPLATAAPSDSPDVFCPPRSGPTFAAFSDAGSPFQHLKTPKFTGSPSYVPCKRCTLLQRCIILPRDLKSLTLLSDLLPFVANPPSHQAIRVRE
ncbi:jg23637 [Pararge aegeria aegeria]|uniref:Jg23637 protein n=1 Tax=Pararge aegeria aegeria TaxID=348720 RepID=A0A8S4SCF8_9NEOP|nr:jg23637 [Pararge aegeria aegeria]